ncbi:hypothetical protein V1227_06475 [Lentzea sp. DG1S-22]|uniref:hypothetical protein n=1 Tax=Lentzea sp. DG1S-22 TaxID=3108822 RepID=UPI002E77A3E8|nr:hypothetical protein [Lentzea sp. DG1S-22]WVH82398.1 hypothetical protein V1227_06475 [Lentzea sp. DG1S-22]
MSNRTGVDVDALRRGGVNILKTSQLARDISSDLANATVMYGGSGGTGEMGEAFDKGYKPTAERALAFLDLLEEVLGGASDRTLETSRSFEATVDEANAATEGL